MEFKKGDAVAFLWGYSDDPQEIWVVKIEEVMEERVFLVILYGHHSCSEFIPFEDILAIGDMENGDTRISNYSKVTSLAFLLLLCFCSARLLPSISLMGFLSRMSLSRSRLSLFLLICLKRRSLRRRLNHCLLQRKRGMRVAVRLCLFEGEQHGYEKIAKGIKLPQQHNSIR